MDESRELRSLAGGYQVSQALHVVAVLGIADELRDGARTSAELAEVVGAHEPSLYRLLRALATVGVFEEHEGRRFSLAQLGEPLRSDAPRPVGAWAEFIGRPYHWNAWGHLLHTIRTGENAMRHTLGESVWDYRARHPEESAIFDRAMVANTRSVNAAVVAAYDFGRYATIVDVGGGYGELLRAILDANPGSRGVLFDQQHVVEKADVPERCDVVAGSFFDAVPPGGDAYVLKSIVHDWEDEENLRILRACRDAMRPEARVVVVEFVVEPPNEGRDGKFMDLLMLVGPGGRERTLDEFGALFEASGLRLEGSTPTAAGVSVLEAAPA